MYVAILLKWGLFCRNEGRLVFMWEFGDSPFQWGMSTMTRHQEHGNLDLAYTGGILCYSVCECYVQLCIFPLTLNVNIKE